MKIIIYGTGWNATKALNTLRQKYSDDIIAGFTQTVYDDKKKEICSKPVYKLESLTSWGGGVKFYISPEWPLRGEIQAYLLDNGYAEKEDILNYESCQKYVSCVSLEEMMVLSDMGFYNCCYGPGRNFPPLVRYKDNISEAVDDFLIQRDDIIQKLKTNAKNPCSGCPALKSDYWKDKKETLNLAVGLSYPCQLACSYCTWEGNSRNIAKANAENLTRADEVDVPSIIRVIEDKGIFPREGMVNFASGEITISKKCDEILDASSNHPVGIYSNGIIYSERIANLVSRNDGSYLNVSVDAGTSETYKSVKGLDVFEKVKTALFRYREKGAHIILKYILLDKNNNEADLRGFVNLMQDIKPDKVSVSFDFNMGQEGITEAVTDGAAYLVGECRKRDILCNLISDFGKSNIERIEEKINSEI